MKGRFLTRIGLFILTNIAVLVVLSVVLRLIGFQGYMDQHGVGLDYTALLVFSAVVGFTGAFISLALSKFIAKRATGAQVIASPRNETESWLFNTVDQLSRKAGISSPEIAIYDSDDMNAFATGARRNAALVAVSTGLLRRMDRKEVEAVLGHEIAHVANGDMVTLTLIQGVVNTFVIFLSRVVGHFVDRVLLRNERGHGIGFWVATMVAQVVFGILASIIVAWFSRRREFRADAGSADLLGARPMIGALSRLKGVSGAAALPDSMQAFGIRGGGVAKLFSTHPDLDDRIAALQSRA